MVKRTNHVDLLCDVARPLNAIGDGWLLLTVRDVFDGLRRFGESQRSLGLSKNTLVVCLRNLIAYDILETVSTSDGNAYQNYVPTGEGHALSPLLAALR